MTLAAATRKHLPVSRPCLGREELDQIESVLKSGWLGLGETVSRFEQAVADFVGAKHVVAVNTGTSALHLALELLELQPGDEVILPSLTFAASVRAVTLARGTPVFADIESKTLNLSVEDVRNKITSRTRVIMPVHLTGEACDLERLMVLADEHRLHIVEDAAHAFGTTYLGRKIGSIGHLTCFSFDPIKNITCGEGGAVCTSRPDWAERLRLLRNLGMNRDAWKRIQGRRPWYYEIESEGFRYHMPNLNAAIGLAQMQKVESFIRRRREIVRAYDDAFRSFDPIILPLRRTDETAYFCYTVRVLERRDELIEYLRSAGIGANVNYIPNHLQPFAERFRTPLPATEEIWPQIISLPLYVDMNEDDVRFVVSHVRRFLTLT